MHRVGSWCIDYLLRVSFTYLWHGFRLHLYKPDEYGTIYWYLTRMYQDRVQNSNVRMYSVMLAAQEGKTKHRKGGKKKKLAAKLKNSARPLTPFLHVQSELRLAMCYGMFYVRARGASWACLHVCVAHAVVCGVACQLCMCLEKAQLVRVPAVSHCDPVRRYYHRFGVFVDCAHPRCARFDEFMADADVPAVGDAQPMQVAAQQAGKYFRSAGDTAARLLSATDVLDKPLTPAQRQELQNVVAVANHNAAVCQKAPVVASLLAALATRAGNSRPRRGPYVTFDFATDALLPIVVLPSLPTRS